jgi:hypothetical protein
MAIDIKGIPTKELDLEGAFQRSRNGAIVLTVVLGSYILQLLLILTPAIEGWQTVFEGIEPSDSQYEAVGMSVILGGLALLALVATLFAWFMRSRVAMWFGVAFFLLNWISYALVWMSGDFDISGLLLNILGPYYLWRGIQGAYRYHALKSGRVISADVSAFE